MSVTLQNVAGRPASTGGFCHATAAEGDRIVHMSGQVGADASGPIVAGLQAQTVEALHPVALALGAAGAKVEDPTRIRSTSLAGTCRCSRELTRGRDAARKRHPFPDVAFTLIGVTSLFTP
jgi:hypothetical protein